MAASSETESEETLRRLFILAGIMLCHLIDPRLIQPRLAVGVENVLLVWRGNVYRGLHVLVCAAKVDFALLRVGLIHYFLVLLPEKIGFRRSEVGSAVIHLRQHTLEIAIRTPD